MNPIYRRVEGAPYQPGERVRITSSTEGDDPLIGVTGYIGRVGVIVHLEYECGCGQTYPGDPMIGVRFDDGSEHEFWAEELTKDSPV